MREKVGNSYETVGLCGSFRQHLRVISQVHDDFTNAGFRVIAPSEVGDAVNPDDDFVILSTDPTGDPEVLEGRYQRGLLNSDVVYVCNPGGYIGGSVMMELGRLVNVAEVYFMHEPQEPVIRQMAKYAILSTEELISRMKFHNDVFGSREWPDRECRQTSNFAFPDL